MASHGPNSFYNYINIHTTVMAKYAAQGFVLEDGLAVDDLGDGIISIAGLVRCNGGVTIRVEKYLAVVDAGPPAIVRTDAYSYNASLDGHGNIFRYCSPHPDHNCFHHRHAYDVFAGDRVGTVERLDQWPTLGDVICELRNWTSDYSDRLTWT